MLKDIIAAVVAAALVAALVCVAVNDIDEEFDCKCSDEEFSQENPDLCPADHRGEFRCR